MKLYGAYDSARLLNIHRYVQLIFGTSPEVFEGKRLHIDREAPSTSSSEEAALVQP